MRSVSSMCSLFFFLVEALRRAMRLERKRLTQATYGVRFLHYINKSPFPPPTQLSHALDRRLNSCYPPYLRPTPPPCLRHARPRAPYPLPPWCYLFTNAGRANANTDTTRRSTSTRTSPLHYQHHRHHHRYRLQHRHYLHTNANTNAPATTSTCTNTINTNQR